MLAALRAAQGKALSVGEVVQRARLHPGERTQVKRILRDLARQGLVQRDEKRFSVPAPRSETAEPGTLRAGKAPRLAPPVRGGPGITGTLTRHRDGYGFVARLDRKGEDVFVPPDEAAQAFDGDLVRVELAPARGGRTLGRNLRVLERRRRWALGTYHARGKMSFVLPAGPEALGTIPVPETDAAADGDLVKVALQPGTGRLEGRVVERVGAPGEPRVEALRVAYGKGFSDLFPDPVRQEAEAVPDHVTAADREGRRDLTGLRLVTIDGADARDFDDAVFVERLGTGKKGGWRLVVAIADVAHYVRKGQPLDDEARRRGTSVYFPSLVLPMLPERLSNGICSLNPQVDRLCLVADMRIDDRGEAGGAEIYPAVMRSVARCTYDEVAASLAGERVAGKEHLRADFAVMADLQERLGAMRARRGSIDFDLPEAKVVLGPEGQVASIEKRPRNRAHRIVEEFMLAANEAVARHFGERQLPTIYRVHGLPDEEKLDSFRELAQAHGFQVPEGPLSPAALNALLHRIQGHAQQRAMNQLLLRAMMQAIYSPENIGHFGLAAESYLHFTSPIRRYPDLIVHRLLWEGWAGGERTRERELTEAALLSSERERAAMQAEREIQAFYAALLLSAHVGERFPGVVASVAEVGLFVELGPWFVEGLVKTETLGDGFAFDPRLHALAEPRSGRAYRVGDAVEIEVAAASPARRQVDLLLVEGGRTLRSGDLSAAGRGQRGREERGGRGPARGAAAKGRVGGKRDKGGGKHGGRKGRRRR
ncbi:MAG: ribonuclease R [Deltaproteobacteria bacterium]|nr:ribonuclease R [Deltaproteobacteria bacterium]